jgi:hypothetical protein
MHLCPVCGYDRLSEPPLNFTICPSCGTEFGYDDAFASHAQLRLAWLRDGAQWWSPADARPDNWDPHLQVAAVESSLWEALRAPLPNQQAASASVDVMRAERQQSRPPARDPLSFAPKQVYTAQAA